MGVLATWHVCFEHGYHFPFGNQYDVFDNIVPSVTSCPVEWSQSLGLLGGTLRKPAEKSLLALSWLIVL